MVTENGVRNQLKVLDKDKTTSCYQIKQKVDEILATLSSEVKNVYEKLLEAEKMEEEAEYEYKKIKYRNQGLMKKVEYIEKAYAIKKDMSLSKGERKAKLRVLKQQFGED
ncbi:unnamed protein product [Dracunculus medinensis]|uniref:MAT1 domain-containing protein n=1 Tax=Dracunculus medinensis TaxID=318479 RepID=A0A0N4U2K6_DRAME|nr:unnamed protein product [Dracunculus medinensis]